ALYFRQFVERLGEGGPERVRVAARLANQPGDAVLLLEQRKQQVLGLDLLVVAADGEALRLGDGLLQAGGELVETHCLDFGGFPLISRSFRVSFSRRPSDPRRVACWCGSEARG